jgi:hypothetical protein
VLVNLISRVPIKKVGTRLVLVVTTRGLCCCPRDDDDFTVEKLVHVGPIPVELGMVALAMTPAQTAVRPAGVVPTGATANWGRAGAATWAPMAESVRDPVSAGGAETSAAEVFGAAAEQPPRFAHAQAQLAQAQTQPGPCRGCASKAEHLAAGMAAGGLVSAGMAGGGAPYFMPGGAAQYGGAASSGRWADPERRMPVQQANAIGSFIRQEMVRRTTAPDDPTQPEDFLATDLFASQARTTLSRFRQGRRILLSPATEVIHLEGEARERVERRFRKSAVDVTRYDLLTLSLRELAQLTGLRPEVAARLRLDVLGVRRGGNGGGYSDSEGPVETAVPVEQPGETGTAQAPEAERDGRDQQEGGYEQGQTPPEGPAG